MTAERPGAGLIASALLAAAAAGCSGPKSLACTTGPAVALPEALDESSGVAWSGGRADVFWTVNDGSEGVLYAVDTTGALLGRVETTGMRLQDVEALAGGQCGDQYCLYLADTGDNLERRDQVAVHRLPEPGVSASSAQRRAFPARFPHGARDVEALFVLPGERVYLLSKGRTAAPTLYRYPGPLGADSVVVLESVGALGRRAASFTGRITGATRMTGADDLVLIRSYESMELLQVTPEGIRSVPGSRLDLRFLQEAQGEAVSARDDGHVVLTSEAGPLTSTGTFRILDCRTAVTRTPED